MARQVVVVDGQRSGLRSFLTLVAAVGLLSWAITSPVEAAHTVRDVLDRLGDAIGAVQTFLHAVFG